MNKYKLRCIKTVPLRNLFTEAKAYKVISYTFEEDNIHGKMDIVTNHGVRKDREFRLSDDKSRVSSHGYEFTINECA